ncbi:MAG: DUF2066 domain-containing protein [Pseudomonadota bacterium]
MRHFWKLTILLLAMLAVPPGAQAARLSNLYTAQIPVVDRTDETLQEALRAALAQVLVRVTGQRGIASDPDLVEMLDGADRLVLQRQYTRDGELRVTFDGNAVEQLAVTAGLPVWGANRPATLVWLAVDDGAGERRLVAAGEEDEVQLFLAEVAAERGVPLLWPLMDSQDREALAFADVWGNFRDRIDAASERYSPDAVLIGRAAVANEGYSVRWNLTISEISDDWQSSLDDGVHRTADLFASFLTINDSGDGARVALIVDGIDSLRSYALVMRYLEQLTLISLLEVREVMASTVTFDLELRDHPAKLVRAISLGAPLRARGNTVPADVTGNSTLRYVYVE